MAYLEVIPRYKDKLFEQFTQNLTISRHTSQILPYPFVPNEQTQNGTYLAFDLYVPQVRDKHLKDLQIVVNVFSHKEQICHEQNLYEQGSQEESSDTQASAPGENRVDLICAEIDRILNGNRDFGIDGVSLVSVLAHSPAKDYYGKQLTYAALDFNQKNRTK